MRYISFLLVRFNSSHTDDSGSNSSNEDSESSNQDQSSSGMEITEDDETGWSPIYWVD